MIETKQIERAEFEFGLLGERLALAYLLRDKGKFARLNSGPDPAVYGCNGVSFYNSEGRLIIPDISVRWNKRALTTSLGKKAKDFVIEVKTKSCFGFLENAQEVRTGIELEVFNEYIKYEMEMDDVFEFYFIQVLSVCQIGHLKYFYHEHAVGGIYRASVASLRRTAQLPVGTAKMVTWPMHNGPFELLVTMQSLKKDDDTKDMVLELGNQAMKKNQNINSTIDRNQKQL